MLRQLISRARQIKTETSERANTATRVGSLLEDICVYLDGELSNKINAQSSELQTQAKDLIDAINEIYNLVDTQYKELVRKIPTKLSQLENDCNYITKSDYNAVIDIVEEYPQVANNGDKYLNITTCKIGRRKGNAWIETPLLIGETIRVINRNMQEYYRNGDIVRKSPNKIDPGIF